MANILQVDDFLNAFYEVGNITIGDGSDPIILANRKQVQGWIDRYEPIGLKHLLGDSLFTEFKKWFDGNKLPVDARFEALLDGATFTGSDGFEYKWGGLKAMLLPYVYYFLLTVPNFNSIDFGSNEKKWATDVRLTNSVWNDNFIILYGLFGAVNENSAFAYLHATKDDFPTWRFDELGIQRTF